MEKIENKFKNWIFVLSISFLCFFWDATIFSLNLKSLFFISFIFLIIEYKKNFRILFNKKILILFLFFLILFLHFYYNSALYRSVPLHYEANFYFNLYNFKRYILLFLTVMLIIIYKQTIIKSLEKSICFFTSILFLILIYLLIVNPSSLIDFFSTIKFLFIENSHFGMIGSSIFLYSLNEFIKSKKIIHLANFFIILIFSYLNFSLTFFLGLFLSSLVIAVCNYLILNKMQLLVLSLVMLISISSIYLDKKSLSKINAARTSIDLISNKPVPNLSVEVYNSSYKIMIYSLMEKPFGYGFNNYEQAFFEHIDKINVQYDKTKVLNSKDASINFTKIVTETGVFSLVFIYLLVVFVFSPKVRLEYKFLLIPNLLTQTFIRGAGYFNGGYLIYLLLVVLLLYNYKLESAKKY